MNLLKKSKLNGDSIAFMPIKPIYAEKIIKGEKKFEFRRKKINQELVYIIIYSTSPIKKIVAISAVKRVSGASLGKTWLTTRDYAGITKREFQEYFQGKEIAWSIELKNVVPLRREVAVSKIKRFFHIPQSFRYVDVDFLLRVIREGFA